MGVGYPGSASYGEEWKNFPPKKEDFSDYKTNRKDILIG